MGIVHQFWFFVIEMTTGWISSSMGLIADSLDMLADSIVYALSLFAVGGAISRKKESGEIQRLFSDGVGPAGIFGSREKVFEQ